MNCCKPNCDLTADKKSGHSWYCIRHYRFIQMKARAKRDGKSVPTTEHLEKIGMNLADCPDCNLPMNWDGLNSPRARVASMQHYRDGTIGIVCMTCNLRHAAMDGDSYRKMPKDHKYCAMCKVIKPKNEFNLTKDRGLIRHRSYCRSCKTIKMKSYRKSKVRISLLTAD